MTRILLAMRCIWAILGQTPVRGLCILHVLRLNAAARRREGGKLQVKPTLQNIPHPVGQVAPHPCQHARM